jgi:hypothetical protein
MRCMLPEKCTTKNEKNRYGWDTIFLKNNDSDSPGMQKMSKIKKIICLQLCKIGTYVIVC